jgi:hypothetical protein
MVSQNDRTGSSGDGGVRKSTPPYACYFRPSAATWPGNLIGIEVLDVQIPSVVTQSARV